MFVTFVALGVAVGEAIADSVGVVVTRLRLKKKDVTAHEPTPATKTIKIPKNQLTEPLLFERVGTFWLLYAGLRLLAPATTVF